ncbi:MAG: UbiA family prenyltransferase [Verrucomicrobia bacterium]|nr:UbiA family prenyltransferase [Verrucomicrobiota bacterium]
MESPGKGEIKAWLALGRPANLPTIWSNCLAGWILGGDRHVGALLATALGATCLYFGGVCLNDALDADHDRAQRPERPIPSGRIQAATAWRVGLGLLAFGFTLLALLGPPTVWFAILLLFFILLYDLAHRRTQLAPLVMGACRAGLYLVAASAAAEGVQGLAVWSAFALGAYVAGVGFFAEGEARDRAAELPHWPWLPLLAPILLALTANRGPYFDYALTLSLLMALWLLPLFAWQRRRPGGNPAFLIAGLHAGIALADALAAAEAGGLFLLAFLALFALTLLGQRFLPSV